MNNDIILTWGPQLDMIISSMADGNYTVYIFQLNLTEKSLFFIFKRYTEYTKNLNYTVLPKIL